MRNKLIGILMTLSMVVCLVPNRIAAYTDTDNDYVAIGDSISSDANSFVNKISGYTLAVNAAKGGNTIDKVLDSVSNDDIKQAELITLTVGGNDLLEVIFTELATKVGSTPAAVKAVFADSTSDAELYNKCVEALKTLDVAAAMETELKAFAGEFLAVMTELRSLNPTATIIVPTQYNPFGSDVSQTYPTLYGQATDAIAALNAVITGNALVYGYRTVDMSGITGVNAGFDVHLTEAGHTAYAAKIDEEVAKTVELTYSVDGKELTALEFEKIYENIAYEGSKVITIKNTGSVAIALTLPENEQFTYAYSDIPANAYGTYTLDTGKTIKLTVTPNASKLTSDDTTTTFEILGSNGYSKEIAVNTQVINTTKITIYPNNGEAAYEVIAINGLKAPEIKIPTYAGYNFTGFYVADAEGKANTQYQFINAQGEYVSLVNADGNWDIAEAELSMAAAYDLANYNIWICTEAKNGTCLNQIRIDGKNMTDVLGDIDGEKASVVYNPETKVLTLNGANIYSITADKEIFTVNVLGSNVVDEMYITSYDYTKATFIPTVINGTGSLKVKYIETYDYNIGEYTSLTIAGQVTLNADYIDTYNLIVKDSAVVNADEIDVLDFTVETGATVTAEHVMAWDVVVNGTLNVNADNYYGIEAVTMLIGKTGKVLIDGATKGVILDNGDAPYADTFKILEGGVFETTNTDIPLLVIGFFYTGAPAKEEAVINLPNGYLPSGTEIKVVEDEDFTEYVEEDAANNGYFDGTERLFYYVFGKELVDVSAYWYEGQVLMFTNATTEIKLGNGSSASNPEGENPSTPTLPGTTPNPGTGDGITTWMGLLFVSLSSLGLCVRRLFGKAN